MKNLQIIGGIIYTILMFAYLSWATFAGTVLLLFGMWLPSLGVFALAAAMIAIFYWLLNKI